MVSAFAHLHRARGGRAALITIECWPEDAGRANPVWHEALRSPQVKQYLVDPSQG